jgi:hypothetical protein
MKTKAQKQFDQQIRQIQHPPAEQDVHPNISEETSCEGLSVVDNRIQIAESLMPNVMQVLISALKDAITAGVRSDEEVAEIVCRNSSCWPVPDEYLSCVEMFIISYCTKSSRPDKETQKFLRDIGSAIRRRSRFLTFHNGRNHYYDELPDDILKLRETATFWIYPDRNEFISRGEQRDKQECPPPRALKMLQFLCLERNAGRIIPFNELYSYVWVPISLPTKHDMRNSINEAQNQINNFAADRFISDKSKNDNAKVIRIRGEDKVEVSEATPREYCIIKVIKCL